jgi:hypothetical protein
LRKNTFRVIIRIKKIFLKCFLRFSSSCQKQITGHATKDIGDDYIKPKPELIYEKAVMKIDWGLDFNHLKISKFVIQRKD